MPKYYTTEKIDNTGALWRYIGGPRGCGKTTGVMTKLCELNDSGQTWAYVRRYSKEITASRMARVLRKVGQLKHREYFYKDRQFFDVTGGKKKLVGEVFCLTDGDLDKSINFDDIGGGIFDEYTVSPYSYRRYLDREFDAFCELYKTIARQRDIPWYFLGNNQRAANPYLQSLGLKNPRPGEIYINGDAAVERCQSMAALGFKKSRFDKMVSGTAYGRYSYEGGGMDDFSGTVRRQAAYSVALYDLIANGNRYGVFVEPKNGDYYVRAKPANTPRVLSADEPPERGIPIFARTFEAKRLREQAQNYKIYYSDEETAETITSIVL